MSKLCFVFLGLVAVASASGLSQFRSEFEQFEAAFEKQYASPQERESKFRVFARNLIKMEEFNKMGYSYQKGVNQFSDLTDEEFKAKHLTGYLSTVKGGSPSRSRSAINAHALPDSVDWRVNGSVTPAKNQGACGSCWAFATVETIESYVHIETGNLMELSAQHVTACTPNPLHCGGTGGCGGSIPQLGYSYVQLFGLATEADYPYTAGTFGNDNCEYDANSMSSAATLRGYESLPANDQDAVMEHLATKGPLAIAVAASAWGSYGGGIFTGCSYDRNIELNHAVQLVGYGTEGGKDFWIVRNSWGGSWGEHGYIRLARDATAQCGTNNTPLMGVGCENDGIATQHVCGMCGILFDTNYPIGAMADDRRH